MSPLYLRYRNTPSDPWTEVPSLTSVIPSQAVGSLPLEKLSFATEPAMTSTCGCSDASANDDHYILHAGIAALPQSASLPISAFLLAYKQATYHEAKYDRYGTGYYITSDLTLYKCKEESGMSRMSFRLGSPL